MSKRKSRKRTKAHAAPPQQAPPPRGKRQVWTVVAIALVLAAGAFGAARWRRTRLAAEHAAGTTSPASAAQGGSFSPSSPSKEYIYLGDRLIATEEPTAAGGSAPSNLVATANSTTTVAVAWTAPTGSISRYQVERSGGAGFALVSEPTGTTFNDSGLTPTSAYLYRVRAVYTTGGYSDYSNTDLATTVIFTDHPLGQGVTIMAPHLNQLRGAVNAVRALAGLPASSWAYPDPVSEPAQSRRRVYLEDVQELRTGIDPALTALGRYAPYPAEPALARYAVVSKEHFMQIRARVE